MKLFRRFRRAGGLALQLLDVSDPHDPALTHKLVLGMRGSASEATMQHLAFTHVPELDLLAIGATLCHPSNVGNLEQTFSGLLLFRLDRDTGFTRLGAIPHRTDPSSCRLSWSQSTSAVERSVVIDGNVFSISDDRIKVRHLDRLDVELADVSLPR